MAGGLLTTGLFALQGMGEFSRCLDAYTRAKAHKLSFLDDIVLLQ